jgi:endonuclease/exonuclease/phosphatase family metal-dependent hydrolase
MSGAGYGGRRRSVAVVFFVVAVSLLLAGSIVAGGPARAEFRVLQLNLCNSGIADCYTGRSVDRAAAVIRVNRPDVVTFNEVCYDDVYGLYQALRGTYQDNLAWAFQAAADRRTGGDFQCRNGQPYGIGLLVRLASASAGYATAAGVYPSQDPGDPEERAWLCVRAVGSILACTTHLASTSAPVAVDQCHYLFDTAVPWSRGPDRDEPAVVAGDFNLGHGLFNLVHAGAGDMQACLPAGYVRADDGAVQQVLASSGFTIGSTDLIDMHGTTDHPGLLVSFRSIGTG